MNIYDHSHERNRDEKSELVIGSASKKGSEDDDDEGEEEKGEQASIKKSSRRKGIKSDRTNNTADQIVISLSRIGEIKPKSYPTKTVYYYNKRLKGCGKCRFRAVYNAWPHVEDTAWERKLTNKDSELFKKLVLEYNDCIPCHVFNIKKERYWHWVAFTP